jgi:hypothetical protein
VDGVVDAATASETNQHFTLGPQKAAAMVASTEVLNDLLEIIGVRHGPRARSEARMQPSIPSSQLFEHVDSEGQV